MVWSEGEGGVGGGVGGGIKMTVPLHTGMETQI